MINFSTFLLESRLDFIKQQNPEIDSSHDSLAVHRSASDIIDHFASKADPNPKKSNTQWIISRYKNKDFRQEDHPRIRTALEDFEKHKTKLPLAQRDINQYQSLVSLEDAVEPHLGTISKKQEKSQIKHEGADLIHDGPQFMVHRLKTKEAACHYGKGTKWCTAADRNNKFDLYNKEGPLYVVTHKPTQEKHQFHFESDQFTDSRDVGIDLHKFVSKNPELKEVQEFREKSPYFVRHPKEFDESMQKVLKNSSVQMHAIRHPNATPEHISTLLKHLNAASRAREAAIRRPNATSEHLSTALKDENHLVRWRAIQHPNATPEHISTALKDKVTSVRSAAIRRPNVTPEQISAALKDRSREVRETAFRHPSVTPEQISTALKGSDVGVRRTVLGNPNVTSEHISTALNDEDKDVRRIATHHPNATSEHISTALKDKDWYVRVGAIGHRTATPEQILIALNDENHNVRKAAKSIAKQRGLNIE